MEFYAEWLLANAMLFVGILFIFNALKKIYRRDDWGMTLLAIGVIIVLLCHAVDDWDHILAAFRTAWETAFK